MRHSDWDDFYQLEPAYTIDDGTGNQVPETIDTTDFKNSCGRRLWASEWFRLFKNDYTCHGIGETQTDGQFVGTDVFRRDELKWRDRFSEVTNHPGVMQFFSSGEDVVRAATEGDPGFDQLGTPFNGGINAWNFQEKSKGLDNLTAFLQPGDTQGGWGFRVCDTYYDSIQDEVVTIYCNDFMTPAQAFAQSNSVLRDTPFFRELRTVTPNSDAEVNELLAYAIPALSYGAGGAGIVRFQTQGVAQDMNDYPGSDSNPDWPDERQPFEVNDANEDLYWLHSDFKDVAYRYVYKLYDAMVVRGELK